MVKVKVSAPLKKFVGNSGEQEVKGYTLFEALNEFSKNYPSFLSKICNSKGDIYHYINVFVNDINIKEIYNINIKINENLLSILIKKNF
ncbi:MAG: hypothetical protein ACK4NF_07655 [Planctomycetota bacterium]